MPLVAQVQRYQCQKAISLPKVTCFLHHPSTYCLDISERSLTLALNCITTLHLLNITIIEYDTFGVKLRQSYHPYLTSILTNVGQIVDTITGLTITTPTALKMKTLICFLACLTIVSSGNMCIWLDFLSRFNFAYKARLLKLLQGLGNRVFYTVQSRYRLQCEMVCQWFSPVSSNIHQLITSIYQWSSPDLKESCRGKNKHFIHF